MDDVLFLILQGVNSIVHILSHDFVITLGSFTFSLWDFFVACAVLSIVVPLLVITRSSSPLATFFHSSISERNNK